MSDTKKCFAKCSFFFTNIFQDKSLCCPRLFTVTKNFSKFRFNLISTVDGNFNRPSPQPTYTFFFKFSLQPML